MHAKGEKTRCEVGGPFERTRPRSASLGVTLLEVALYSAVLLAIGAPLVSAVLTSTRCTREVDILNAVAERNRTIVLAIEKEVRRAISSTVSIQDSGRTLALTVPGGFNGSSILPGDSFRFQIRLAPGEAANGLDDNGNGLVDEGELVRTNVATGQTLLMSGGIDVNGSGFAQSGTGFRITIANFGSGQGGSALRVSKSVTVYPRN